MEVSTLLLLPLIISFLTLFTLFFLLHKTHNPTSPPPPENPLLCHQHDDAPAPSTPSTEEVPAKEQEQEEHRKRRKRGRKKRQQQPSLVESREEPATKAKARSEDGGAGTVSGTGTGTGTKYPLLPFSSVTSSLQKRIKSNYDQILKMANQSNVVTVPQVSEFIGCLVEARDELQHRSEQIQRSYKIKKALLSTANKSSFDRLWDEAHKLEKEHKRLEADAAVYNLLQEQLKLSQAYKTLLDLSVKMGKEAQNEEIEDFPDISFEELLAQEKKDSIWQRNGRMRSFPK